jgi:hypothetical protein
MPIKSSSRSSTIRIKGRSKAMGLTTRDQGDQFSMKATNGECPAHHLVH